MILVKGKNPHIVEVRGQKQGFILGKGGRNGRKEGNLRLLLEVNK